MSKSNQVTSNRTRISGKPTKSKAAPQSSVHIPGTDLDLSKLASSLPSIDSPEALIRTIVALFLSTGMVLSSFEDLPSSPLLTLPLRRVLTQLSLLRRTSVDPLNTKALTTLRAMSPSPGNPKLLPPNFNIYLQNAIKTILSSASYSSQLPSIFRTFINSITPHPGAVPEPSPSPSLSSSSPPPKSKSKPKMKPSPSLTSDSTSDSIPSALPIPEPPDVSSLKK